MKKNILVFASTLFMLFVFAGTSQAQSNKEETDLMQSIFGMEKKAVVADFLKIESSNPFWALYDEYETKRKELGKERITVLENYVQNYDKLTDAKYDEAIASMIKLRKSNDKLTDDYYKKIKKASGSKVAAQFFQIEAYFASQIRAAIMDEIPYIGEFDK